MVLLLFMCFVHFFILSLLYPCIIFYMYTSSYIQRETAILTSRSARNILSQDRFYIQSQQKLNYFQTCQINQRLSTQLLQDFATVTNLCKYV